MRHIVPSTSVSRDDPFRAANVTFMRKESDTSETEPIKDSSGSVDNFADQARLEKIDHVRKSLAENTYRVSAADLAGKIIDYMLQS
jgi:anti-sigma28 factor (negative regulator of flagellin synthesis)